MVTGGLHEGFIGHRLVPGMVERQPWEHPTMGALPSYEPRGQSDFRRAARVIDPDAPCVRVTCPTCGHAQVAWLANIGRRRKPWSDRRNAIRRAILDSLK